MNTENWPGKDIKRKIFQEATKTILQKQNAMRQKRNKRSKVILIAVWKETRKGWGTL